MGLFRHCFLISEFDCNIFAKCNNSTRGTGFVSDTEDAGQVGTSLFIIISTLLGSEIYHLDTLYIVAGWKRNSRLIFHMQQSTVNRSTDKFAIKHVINNRSMACTCRSRQIGERFMVLLLEPRGLYPGGTSVWKGATFMAIQLFHRLG